MSLVSFKCTDFRCLESVELAFEPSHNLIYGPNAAGKTSILEAIAYLGRARSFRGAGNRELVRHGQEDFTLTTQDKMLEVLGDILDLLTVGVAALAAISLLVGAVGIATIMTIAVTERTPEVGLLRALGAPRRAVVRMFLTESALLGGTGGAAGVAISLAIVETVGWLAPDAPVSIAWPYVGVSLAL